jgi:hypothetical protein
MPNIATENFKFAAVTAASESLMGVLGTYGLAIQLPQFERPTELLLKRQGNTIFSFCFSLKKIS